MKTKTLPDLYSNLKKSFPVSKDLSLKQDVNFQSQKDSPIQRWLRYREGYSVELIEKVISELSINGPILDPFLGSGTTTYVAAKRNISSYGIEINPFASFVAQVKTRKYDAYFVENFKKILPRLLKKEQRWKKPGLRSIKKIFGKKTLEDLLYLRANIEAIKDKKIKDLAFFIWLSILEETSNTYKEGNGIKYRGKLGYKRPPRKNTEAYLEYVKKIKDLESNDGWQEKEVFQVFSKRFHEVINDIGNIDYKKWGEPKIFTADAKSLSGLLKTQEGFTGVQLAIFSPPYANCFDYYEIFKIELWMGNFIRSYKHLRGERKKGLVSNLNTNLNDIINTNKNLLELLEHIDLDKLWDKRIPQMLKGYFRDMEKVLLDLFDVIQENGYVVIVIANSAYGNIVIPSDLLVAEMAKKIGFRNIKLVEARKTNTSSQQMKLFKEKGVDTDLIRESLIYLQK